MRILLCLLALSLLTGCESKVARARRDLASEDPDRLVPAVIVLGKAEDDNSVPRLVELLEHEDREVRRETAKALGLIGDHRACEPLGVSFEEDESARVRDAARKALEEIGPASIPVLVRALNSWDTDVRAGAARSLGRLRAHEAVDRLIRMVDDRDPTVRTAAIQALRRIGDQRGLDAVARAIADPERAVQEEAIRQLGGEGYQDQLDRAKRLIRGAAGR